MVIEIVKHLLRPLLNSLQELRSKEYREFLKLRGKLNNGERHKDFNLKALGLNLSIPDGGSFLSSFKTIFVDDIYRFIPVQNEPVIIDIGANIGLSTIYFSKNYPSSRIISYEADPVIFRYLKNNCDKLLNKPILYNRAVWSEDTSLFFKSTGDDAGKIVPKEDVNTVEVTAINIKKLLEEFETIDMLKIDIEGAELEVLKAARNHLKCVHSLFVEYHSLTEEPQGLEGLLMVLAESGFRYYVHPELIFDQPLINKSPEKEFDMRLNIFAINENFNSQL